MVIHEYEYIQSSFDRNIDSTETRQKEKEMFKKLVCRRIDNYLH